MTHSRDFGPLAGEMRAALERYTKEELVDLMTHLVRVYVLEENAPLTPDVQQARAPVELARLSFAQLLLHLQMVLELEELDRFRVSGDQIYVTIGEEEFLIDGPTPVLPPDAIARSIPQAQSVAEAEASLEPAVAAMAGGEVRPRVAESAAPRAPVTGEADFDGDLDDFVGRRHEEDLRKAREAAGLPVDRPLPRPKPVSRPGQRPASSSGSSDASSSGSGRRPRPGGGDGLFGGGGSSSGIGRPLSMRPPAPPPPIAEKAPGDPTPQERDAARAATARADSSNDVDADERRRRAGFDEPPPLADGDREIKSSNRFADLELD